MKSDTIDACKLDCGTLHKVSAHIVNIRFTDGIDITLEDAIAIRKAAIGLFDGQKFLVLVDARNISGTLGKRAGKFFASDDELYKHAMAQALVVNTLGIKLIANFYIMFNQPRREARIFDDVQEALEWLETKKHLLE